MKNYFTRTIEPIVAAIVEAMRRTFLTRTARSQGQSILSFRDPFKLVPINELADIADKFSRNEILTANEIRQIVGIKPATDPKADQLVNSNMPQPTEPPVKVPSTLGDQEQPALEQSAIRNGRKRSAEEWHRLQKTGSVGVRNSHTK